MDDDAPTEEIRRDRGARARSAEAAFLSAGSRLRDGRYLLERRLGSGGMAAVWLARDERLERPVAIKVLSDSLAGDREYLHRFEREARVAAGLTHPNLVKIYDFGAERHRPFLVMEYVEGGDLAALLRARRTPDPERLARELLAALRYIHAAGVLHRDVKSQNVLLDGEGRALLTDFGIAQPPDATSLTQTGMVLGTARYLAPEVLDGGPPSERSDLYSLGVVLGEAIEARPAGAALHALVAALRSADPAARPATAAAALEVLETPEPGLAPTGEETSSRPSTAERPAVAGRRRDLRRPLAIGALAAGAAAALAVVVLAAGGDEEPEPVGSAAAGQERGGADDGRADGREGAGDAGNAAERAERGREPQREGEEQPAEANGFELNDQGFALIEAGRPDEAVPLLQRAVEALEGSGDITYAYALYNLGHALRLAGRPDEAIPILEARLAIPNQGGVVKKELAAAREDAGVADDDDDRGRERGRGRGEGRDDD